MDPAPTNSFSDVERQKNENGSSTAHQPQTQHSHLPLLRSMLEQEQTRTKALEEEGKIQINAPKSSDGWTKSLFIIQARALDWIVVPWLAVVLHATIYTIVQEESRLEEDLTSQKRDLSSWEIFFGIMLNSTLSFLLVFRLNRAAGRFWLARELWGNLVAKGRTMTAGIILHGKHCPYHQNEALRWTAALALSTMEFLRGTTTVPPDIFAGILSPDQVETTQTYKHPPLYTAAKIRYHMSEIFRVHETNNLAYAHTQRLEALEGQLNVMLDCCGGMERIRGTPLPIVYVAHLRTFLVLALVIFPYVWGPEWSWATIPVVATSAFALLGIEAAASEVECPFHQHRINALNMDGYCVGLLSNIQEQMLHSQSNESSE